MTLDFARTAGQRFPRLSSPRGAGNQEGCDPHKGRPACTSQVRSDTSGWCAPRLVERSRPPRAEPVHPQARKCVTLFLVSGTLRSRALTKRGDGASLEKKSVSGLSAMTQLRGEQGERGNEASFAPTAGPRAPAGQPARSWHRRSRLQYQLRPQA